MNCLSRRLEGAGPIGGNEKLKNDRLFQIIYILLEKKTVTAGELAERLSVSLRTIYRDVESLSIAGVPIYTLPGRGGGISLLSGYSFDKSLLSDEEQNQLLFALQGFQAADLNMDMLLSKLGAVFQKTNADWIEVDFSRWGGRRMDAEKFELLKTAILKKRVLHITYCGANGTVSEREIKPFKLIYKDKSWYVRGFCQKADDFRVFKMNRITELALTERQFEEELAPPALESEQPPDFILIPLTLRFSEEVAFRVYDEFENADIEKQSDGSILVTTKLPGDFWVIGYLLSFGRQVEIIEPLSLKSYLSAYAEKIYKHHKS